MPPTIRAVPTAAAKIVGVGTGSIAAGVPNLSAGSHLGGRGGNMRLCVQQAGGSGMSQLSPVKLGQPVLLNTTSQVDVHGYVTEVYRFIPFFFYFLYVPSTIHWQIFSTVRVSLTQVSFFFFFYILQPD